MLCSLRYWHGDEVYIYKWSVHPSMLGCRSWSSERTQHFLETLPPPSGLKSKLNKKRAEAVASSETLFFLRSMCPYKPEHLALHRRCHESNECTPSLFASCCVIYWMIWPSTQQILQIDSNEVLLFVLALFNDCYKFLSMCWTIFR
jgi:hypothetical protein